MMRSRGKGPLPTKGIDKFTAMRTIPQWVSEELLLRAQGWPHMKKKTQLTSSNSCVMSPVHTDGLVWREGCVALISSLVKLL